MPHFKCSGLKTLEGIFVHLWHLTEQPLCEPQILSSVVKSWQAGRPVPQITSGSQNAPFANRRFAWNYWQLGLVGRRTEKVSSNPHSSHEVFGHGERKVQDLRSCRRRRRLLRHVRRGHHGQGPQPLLRRTAKEAPPGRSRQGPPLPPLNTDSSSSPVRTIVR